MKQAIINTICLLLILVTLINCNNESSNAQGETAVKPDSTSPPPQVVVLDKLVGTWKADDGKSFERWAKNDDGTFRSVAFSIKGNDTSWNEHANIYPENNQWVFENTVRDQNEGKAVKFTSLFVNENSVQFSNPSHDFPTDVNYTVPDMNTINAFIIGPNNKGGKDTIPFNYKRVTDLQQQ